MITKIMVLLFSFNNIVWFYNFKSLHYIGFNLKYLVYETENVLKSSNSDNDSTNVLLHKRSGCTVYI